MILFPRPDIGFRSRLFHAAGWSLFPGIFTGAAVGYSRGSIMLGLSVMLAISVVVSGVALLISEGGGWFARRVSHPISIPYRFDHSGARALITRGEIEGGVQAFEEAAATSPEDPVPYIEFARVHRDHLGKHDSALLWFRRARDTGKLSTGEARVVMREILELARKHLDNPLRVAPDLAKHSHQFEGTDEAEWAVRELAEMKAALRD